MVENPWFNRLVLAIILANCVFLAIANPLCDTEVEINNDAVCANNPKWQRVGHAVMVSLDNACESEHSHTSLHSLTVSHNPCNSTSTFRQKASNNAVKQACQRLHKSWLRCSRHSTSYILGCICIAAIFCWPICCSQSSCCRLHYSKTATTISGTAVPSKV